MGKGAGTEQVVREVHRRTCRVAQMPQKARAGQPAGRLEPATYYEQTVMEFVAEALRAELLRAAIRRV